MYGMHHFKDCVINPVRGCVSYREADRWDKAVRKYESQT